MGYLVAMVAAMLVGFLAGLLALKRSSRWCPGCGEVLRCLRCVGQPTPRETLSRLKQRQ